MNMLNKIVSIFFILLANIVLVGHVVVPHHHHESEVCIVSSHCEDGHDSDHSHDHESTGHQHSHDGETETEDCILNQAFIVTSGIVKQEIKEIDLNVPFFTDCKVPDDELSLNKSVNTFFNGKPPPLKTFLFSIYVSRSHGLRAPPIG